MKQKLSISLQCRAPKCFPSRKWERTILFLQQAAKIIRPNVDRFFFFGIADIQRCLSSWRFQTILKYFRHLSKSGGTLSAWTEVKVDLVNFWSSRFEFQTTRRRLFVQPHFSSRRRDGWVNLWYFFKMGHSRHLFLYFRLSYLITIGR